MTQTFEAEFKSLPVTVEIGEFGDIVSVKMKGTNWPVEIDEEQHDSILESIQEVLRENEQDSQDALNHEIMMTDQGRYV